MTCKDCLLSDKVRVVGNGITEDAFSEINFAVTPSTVLQSLTALRECAEREKKCNCWDGVQREAWLSTGATFCQQCGREL